MSEGNPKTSTGIQQNTAGLLCYLGWWITGIVFFVEEKENKIVRLHAIQSIIVFGLITILLIILLPFARIFVPILWIFYIILALAFILWISMMMITATGKLTKLPWAGNLADKYSKIPPAQPPVQPKEEKKD